MLNYLGKSDRVDVIDVRPVLIKKKEWLLLYIVLGQFVMSALIACGKRARSASYGLPKTTTLTSISLSYIKTVIRVAGVRTVCTNL